MIENWTQMPSPYPDMDLWGAVVDQYQFVLTHDRKFKTWAASCSSSWHRPAIRPLGEFRERFEAVAAIDFFLEKLLAGMETL